MQIEEVGLRPHLDPNGEDLDLFYRSLPPEPRRIHIAALGPVPILEKSQKLTLILKPSGAFKAPVVWETTISTCGDIPSLEPWLNWSP
jgi:hypothetical protein